MIEYRKFIRRSQVREERDKLFVFGDNIARRGFGGQAKEMRGEANAVGIPTKKLPSMAPHAFFDNSDKDYKQFVQSVKNDTHRLIAFKGTIVWPTDGIGTGRAQLQQRAPKIWAYIKTLKRRIHEY